MNKLVDMKQSTYHWCKLHIFISPRLVSNSSTWWVHFHQQWTGSMFVAVWCKFVQDNSAMLFSERTQTTASCT